MWPPTLVPPAPLLASTCSSSAKKVLVSTATAAIWFIRGPSGFSLCDDVVVPGSGVVFEGKIAEYQFNADTGVAEFNINKITCDGEELTSFAVGPPQVPRVPLPPATPVMLEMIPGASNKHVKSLKFTIAGDADDVVIENNFYKLGGGFKES